MRLGTHGSLLEVLGHDNKDIACDAVEARRGAAGRRGGGAAGQKPRARVVSRQVLKELTDSDALAEDEAAEAGGKALVAALVEASGLERLVLCLASLNEKEPLEAAAVYRRGPGGGLGARKAGGGGAQGLRPACACAAWAGRRGARNPQPATRSVLAVLENLAEVEPSIADAAFERTKLLRWLLGRTRAKEFDAQ